MKADRFEALDSWRGVCACMVALFHFAAFSHLTFSPLIGNAYLFVDFFFVLSGFVIAANYRDRLADGFGIGRFITLRLGRIYPLHFVMILPFIPIDAMKDGVGPDLWRAIVTNGLLVHGLGVNEARWLDFPSWSISVEFAAYVVFAVVVTRMGRRLWPWLLPVIAGPLILGLISPHGMDSTYDFGFVRCLEGFALGVICFELRERLPILRKAAPTVDTTIEILSVSVVAAIIALAGSNLPLSLATPFLFAVVVLVFARQQGAVSRLLTLRPFLLIGTLSYSIYMVHALVRAVTRAFALALDHLFGMKLFIEHAFDPNGTPVRILWIDNSLYLGDALQIAMLAATILLAILTYRYIEEPGRAWSREFARRKSVPASLLPVGSAKSPALSH
jgi:peptidoglycan/LPS O-acetylase OafA/YrhL